MSSLPAVPAALPAAFRRLAWSNLAAQSAEQVGLAAAPIVAVLALGAGAAETGLLQTAQTLPFLLLAIPAGLLADRRSRRSEEHTSEPQSLMRNSYAGFCLKKTKKQNITKQLHYHYNHH